MRSCKPVEGKFYWQAENRPYLDLEKLHRAKGLVDIEWDESSKTYLVNVISFVFPDEKPDEIKAGIAFTGRFRLKDSETIAKGDVLELKYILRIGVGYASQGTDPRGYYQYTVENVETEQEMVKTIVVNLNTQRTKARITLKRV